MSKRNGSEGVVIVGGGLAAQRCAETLRANGFEAPVRMICAEDAAPYDRPPLSKAYLAGESDDESTALRNASWYADSSVELLLGRRAVALDPSTHTLEIEGGEKIRYGSICIATGSEARRIPFLDEFDNVHYLRTITDARRLRDELAGARRLAVIGAGFIGLEAAATARQLGVEVTVIEALAMPLAHIFGEDVGRALIDLHAARGVEFRLSAQLEQARGNGRVEELVLAGEEAAALECDAVLVGIGVAPATGWLKHSGIECAGGIETDAGGRTMVPGVYAAGDATRSWDPRIGAPARTEHWDAAARQGTAAAKAILGLDPGTPPLPSFWSDQYEARIRYVGHAQLADSHSLEGDPDEQGLTVAFRREGVPVAGLVIDRPRDLAQLRRQIEAPANGAATTEEKR